METKRGKDQDNQNVTKKRSINNGYTIFSYSVGYQRTNSETGQQLKAIADSRCFPHVLVRYARIIVMAVGLWHKSALNRLVKV